MTMIPTDTWNVQAGNANTDSRQSVSLSDQENKTQNENASQQESEKKNENATEKASDQKKNVSENVQNKKNEDKKEKTDTKAKAAATANKEKTKIAVQSAGTLELSKLKGYDADQKTITITKAGQLILLSNCDPKDIKDIHINLNVSGDLDVTGKISQGADLSAYIESDSGEQPTASREYTFQGIGSATELFEGQIDGNIGSIKVNHTFFGGLSSKAEINNGSSKLNIAWCGDGTVPMIAGVYQFDSEKEDGHSLPVSIKKDSKTSAMGSLLGVVKASTGMEKQVLVIDDKVVAYEDASVEVTSSENAGLICNTLKNGTIRLNGYKFPEKKYTLESNASYNDDDIIKAGNAGSVIGAMAEDTALDIQTNVNIPSGTSVTATGNAGGLVGVMQKDAKIVTSKGISVNVNSPVIEGEKSAGGVTGTAKNTLFDEADLQSTINVAKPEVNAGDGASAACVGGFVGRYVLEMDQLSKAQLELTDKIVIEEPNLKAGTSGFSGGYFGTLKLKGKLAYTIAGTEDKKKEVAPAYNGQGAESCGALIGKVTSDTIKSTVKISNVKVTATCENSGSIYHGGLIGEVGTNNDATDAVYLETDNVEISVKTPQVNTENNNGFGGIAGLLAKGSILQANDVTVSTDGNINKGGGLVGYADRSVIHVTGKTDLSGALYEENSGKRAQTGWLAGQQESALIYANGDGDGNGWSYIRGKESTGNKQAMNDIGNYGQIIRLKADADTSDSISKLSSDLIKIDDEHAIQYKSSSLRKDNLTISSEDDFALLSITWNTRGNFGGINGITGDNFSSNSPKSKNITLNSNIDLTGSGITGLTRDSHTDDDVYAGTFNGKNHKVTLAIGETFGFKQSAQTSKADAGEDGYGEVIAASAVYHGRQGLFATIGNATIKDLAIDGNISVSNGGSTNGRADILAGGVAANIGEKCTVKTLGVTVEETITADCANNMGMVVGGFYGGSYENNVTLQLGETGNNDTLNIANAKIEIKDARKDGAADTRICVGGVIGEVGELAFTFKANYLTAKGSIKTDVQQKAYAGGLIGLIKASGYNNTKLDNHKIELNDVTVDGLKISAPKAQDMCGGLLGGIWAGVALSVDKFHVSEATIDAPQADYVGGLAYRSSGKWEIDEIQLDNLTIHAGKDVGLLACRGESSNDVIAGNNVAQGALYLVLTDHWDTSYKISDNVKISVTNTSGVFDEFVAYTTPSASEITDNDKNGVISIATKDRAGVDQSGCTTYQNRTAYGKKHQTNACSRYYYDLDQCQKDLATGSVKDSNNNQKLDTPQELLLWSVWNYACGNIKEYFTKSTNNTNLSDICNKSADDTTWVIGDTTTTTLDMSKYSYYPVKCGTDIDVKNTEIVFDNARIETAETGVNNKSTQGTSADHTQHYTMHSGLFLTYQNSGTLNVEETKFTGSIGKVNNVSSGVLVADLASGNRENNTSNKIYINIKDTVLNGLTVNDCGNAYAPLLINNIGGVREASTYGYASVNIDGLTVTGYTEGKAAASSLIGNVGSEKAKEITMTFQNIVLPDKKAEGTTGIFSRATLLESFAYDKDDTASGATYNFYKDEDWSGDDHKHKVTYGKEITHTTEYQDLQKWYYDEENYGTDDGLVYADADNKTGFDSKAYLPYVYTSYNKDNCTHEIKVNQRVANIVSGCGTYGHPYRITKEREMNILSEYMATGIPRKDWRVTVTANQDKQHAAKSDTEYSSASDVVYQYDGNQWIQVENKGTADKENWTPVKGSGDKEITLPRDFMLDYLLNAYYDIEGTEDSSVNGNQLLLTDFKGFGSTKDRAFRGVITSKNNTTLILEGADTGNGLIPYSYGSVVKDISISYQRTGKTLTYTDNKYYPQVCFGGAIGCVLGGDNIIDGVNVNIADGWLTLAGDKAHLIQAGGYVGSVTGGGVIFRNMKDETGLKSQSVTYSDVTLASEDTALSTKRVGNLFKNILPLNNKSTESAVTLDNDSETSDNKHLYVNPYIGRVLDGFAVSEDTNLDNTDKNYRINTITPGTAKDISVSGNTVTVNNKQGLFVLSAIVNSGAAAGGDSNAYSSTKGETYTAKNANTKYVFAGKYGKVRNASYKNIGTASNDAKSDDQTEPGEKSLPYLINNYSDSGLFNWMKNNEQNMNLTKDDKADYDMTTYGSGYQGIAARYVTNAVLDGTDNYPRGVIPAIKNFNGNASTLTVSMQIKEYADDDFHAASVGGMFNVLRIASGGNISDLQTENTNISLNYYDKDGKTTSAPDTWKNRKEVGLGVVAGSIVGYTTEAANRDVTIEKIHLDTGVINSPASAGGIAGNIGKPCADKNSDIAILLQPQEHQIAYGTAFNDCSYNALKNITGKYAAGGFAGYIGNDGQNPRSSVNGNGFDGTLNETNIGEDSAITATDAASYAGGLFGYVGTRMFINMTDEGAKKDTKAILKRVDVSAGEAVGGCIGKINESCYGLNNINVEGTAAKDAEISIERSTTGIIYAGGIVGYAKGAEQGWTAGWKYAGGVSDSTVQNMQINDKAKASAHDNNGSNAIQTNYIAGGMIGWTAGGKTSIEKCEVNESKVYGSATGGIVGQTDSEMKFKKCTVKGSAQQAMEIKGFSTAGGILGFWTGGNAISVLESNIQYLSVEGKDWGSGAVIGDADSGGAGTLYLFRCSASDSQVTASGNKDGGGGRWPCAGSIIGNLRNTVKASNILLSGVQVTAEKGSYSTATKGILFGSVIGTPDINIAGISIQNVPDTNKNDNLSGNSGNLNTGNNYVAFTDYSGTATADSQDNLLDSESKEDTPVTTASPYVVTSPISSMELYKSADRSGQYLFGDGAFWTKEKNGSIYMKAQDIWKNKDTVTEGHYAYKNTGVNAFDFSTAFSTYNKNQGKQVSDDKDFPVLQIGSGSTDTVKDYLDIVTNGGFSAANNSNQSGNVHVTAKADVYTRDGDKFIKNNDTPAFRVTADNNGKIQFATTVDYDNDKDRFTLLTVTFTEKDAAGTEYKYHIQVPVLVRRMLEMDFSATLTYGTDFKSSDYTDLTGHVLESFGNSITGYLTYTYNSAEGSYTDYGWQSYIDAGGNLMDMKKSVKFVMTTQKFPEGTQLTLIDKTSGRAYYYTATGKEVYNRNGIDIPLTDFKDSDGKAYQEVSISELINAKAESGGSFIKVDQNGKPLQSEDTSVKEYPKPTVRLKNADGKYEYYRLAETSLNEAGQYSIKVDETKLEKDTKSTVTENFYLVLTVPENSDSSALNGSVQTEVTSSIPHQVHYRMIKGGEDNHTNTASTYLISKGYRQSLSETDNDGISKLISITETAMKVHITDTITFPNGQAYNENDQLYQRFVVNLQKTADGNTSAVQFPSGTTGQVYFYVYTGSGENKKYYEYVDGEGWSKKTTATPKEAVTYTWTSDGGNMELPLSSDGTEEKLISLQQVRDWIKGNTSTGDSSVHIEAKINVNLPPAGLDVIPETAVKDGTPENFTKFMYSGQISTEKQSLSYSGNSVQESGTTAYYRTLPEGEKLTYDADYIDQLGINLLDLSHNVDEDKKYAYIDTSALYDLSHMKNLDETLRNSNGITFTLQLLPKNTKTNTESYGEALTDANEYLSVQLNSPNSGTISETKGTWSWTIPKETYVDEDQKNLKPTNVFNGTVFTQAIRLKVRVDNVETAEHFYSNYKVVLTAKVEGQGVEQKSDYIIYTLTKMKPTFQENTVNP